MNWQEKLLREMGLALIKIYFRSDVASDLKRITNELREVAETSSDAALRTNIKALAVLLGEAAEKVDDIRHISEKFTSAAYDIDAE